MVNTVLSVLQVPVAVGVIFLVLLHSGKDAGMSGAFGVGVAGGTSGGSLMEKNLDRWTIIFAVVFALNTHGDPPHRASARPLARRERRLVSGGEGALELRRGARDLTRDVAAVLHAGAVLVRQRVSERADEPQWRAERLVDLADGRPGTRVRFP